MAERLGYEIAGEAASGVDALRLSQELEPDLIILDEPTVGLDPHQIRAVRALIKELGKTTTILLSTHILPEVEMTCSRVLILNQGRILAVGEFR